MAYGDFTQTGKQSGALDNNSNADVKITLHGGEDSIQLPEGISAKDADFSRDGLDLMLSGDHGNSVTIENYFAAAQAPSLEGADGAVLTPKLVSSFMTSDPHYANTSTANDQSPIGAVHEIEGSATITRTDGSTETMKLGTPVYQGDIVETSGDGAVNIMFIDETTLAVSEDARMAIDEYVFDPATSGGVTNVSVLKGVFVYTSGLIGREDPDDVKIDTPSGSIGIRGTIIAANVDSGEVTVVEGAIVLTDRSGNEMTLASQYETARFNSANGTIENMGQLPANDVAGKYGAVANVSGSLFSSIQDNAANNSNDSNSNSDSPKGSEDSQSLDQNGDSQVDGSVDQNGDGSADGSVNEPAAADGKQGDASGIAEPTTDTAQSEPAAQSQSFAETRFGTSNTLGTTTGVSTAMPAAHSAVDGASGIGAHAPIGAHAAVSHAATAAASAAISKSTLSSITETIAPKIAPPAEISPPPTTVTPPVTPPVNPPVTPPVTPPFSVSTTLMAAPENAVGINVASITAINGTLGNVVLNGNFSDMFEFVPIDAQNGYIRLRYGYDLDYETYSTMPIGFTASDASTGANFSGSVNVIVTDVNESPQLMSQTSPHMLSATESSQWSYDFRNDFLDEDIGDTLDFSFTVRSLSGVFLFDDNTAGTSNLIGANSVTFDANGSMSILFGTSFAGLTGNGFMIDVTATDSGGMAVMTTYDFSLYQQQYTFSVGDSATFIITDGNIYGSALSASNVSISGDENRLFFSNTSNTGLVVEGSYNTVHLMDGNDEINIDNIAMNNTISGGNGNDSIQIMNGSNNVYGDADSDRFILDMEYDILGQMATTNSVINGGGDGVGSFFINFGTTSQNGVAARTMIGSGDSLDIMGGTYGSEIDFSTVSNLISNIEFINLNNGENNAVSLSYTDVFRMTDHRDTLIIRGENGDTLDFDTMGERVHTGQQVTHSDTGEVFDVYFVGDITVLVDADIAVTTA